MIYYGILWKNISFLTQDVDDKDIFLDYWEGIAGNHILIYRYYRYCVYYLAFRRLLLIIGTRETGISDS
jgi:hypothetical protein